MLQIVVYICLLEINVETGKKYLVNKNLLFLAVLVCLCVTPAQSEEQLLFQVGDTRSGLNLTDHPLKIQNTQVQDCLNTWFNKSGGQEKRRGIRDVGNCLRTTSNNLWQFFSTSNEEWLIRLDCRGNLIAGKNFGATGSCFSVCVSTSLLSVDVETDATPCLGEMWFTNKSDGLQSWDGTTLTKYPSAPKAARVGCWRNRVILADVSNQQSSLRFSGESNGSDWNNDSRFSTSPLSIAIGGINDGQKIYDIFTCGNELCVFKQLSMSAVSGFDQRNFEVRDISKSIGSIYPETIEEYENSLIFLSNRGIDKYDYINNTFPSIPLSEEVRELIDPLSKAGASARSFTITDQSQWQLGFSTPTGHISASLSPGNIHPTNKTFITSSQSEWGSGTVNNFGGSVLSSSITVGSLVFHSTRQTIVQNKSFEEEGLDVSHAAGWDRTAVTTESTGISFGLRRDGNQDSYDGSFKLRTGLSPFSGGDPGAISVDFTMYVKDTSENILVSTRTTARPIVQQNLTLNTSSIEGKEIKIGLIAKLEEIAGSRVAISTVVSDFTIHVGTSLSVWVSTSNSILGGHLEFNVDFVFGSRLDSEFESFYTSPVFDTLVSSPSYDPFRATVALGTATFAIRTSSDATCCFSADSIITATNPITSPSNRYIQFVSSVSVSPSSGTPETIQINDVTLGSYVTGFHRTTVIDATEDLSSWDLFSAGQVLDDGTINYFVQSSQDGVFSDVGWLAQPLDTVIVAPVQRYIAARAEFQTTASTSIPTVTDISFNWNTGTGTIRPVGVVFDNNYNLFLSSRVGATEKNDIHLVLEKNMGFTLNSGYNIRSVSRFANRLIGGDANETGLIFELEGSTDGKDHGGQIHTFVTYKSVTGTDEDGNSLLEYEKEVRTAYATISREDASQSQFFDITYKVDGGTTSYLVDTIEMSTGTTIATLRANAPTNQQIRGNTFDFTIEEHLSNLGFTIHAFRVYGKVYALR